VQVRHIKRVIGQPIGELFLVTGAHDAPEGGDCRIRRPIFPRGGLKSRLRLKRRFLRLNPEPCDRERRGDDLLNSVLPNCGYKPNIDRIFLQNVDQVDEICPVH